MPLEFLKIVTHHYLSLDLALQLVFLKISSHLALLSEIFSLWPFLYFFRISVLFSLSLLFCISLCTDQYCYLHSSALKLVLLVILSITEIAFSALFCLALGIVDVNNPTCVWNQNEWFLLNFKELAHYLCEQISYWFFKDASLCISFCLQLIDQKLFGWKKTFHLCPILLHKRAFRQIMFHRLRDIRYIISKVMVCILRNYIFDGIWSFQK